MPLNPVGPARQVEAIKRAAEKLSEILGDRIGEATIHLRTDEKMPKRTDGGPSYGFWHRRDEDPDQRRQIWLWDEVDEYPVIKTLAHEAMHVLDDDWLTLDQQSDIIDLMEPTPQTWRDIFINGRPRKYVGLPYETFAVYASRAIGDVGFDRPAYRGIFIRKIHQPKWEKLRDIIDRNTDLGPRGSGGRGDEDQITNIPVPPDTVEELQDQLALADDRLSSAKVKAGEIRLALNQSNVPLATAKASEIEAL